MKDMQDDCVKDIPDLLVGWISRDQLARALGLTADTLARWEARREGPPCTRIGRKTFYRRAAIQDWIRAQEQAHPVAKQRGRRT
jgi:predicted DNA-binding transcriptional regulator AlpA